MEWRGEEEEEEGRKNKGEEKCKEREEERKREEETGRGKGGGRREKGGEGGRYPGSPRGGAASPTRCDHRFYHSWAWAEPFNMLPSAITHLSAGGAMSGRSAGCP